MPKTNPQNEKEITLNSRDLIVVLGELLNNKEYKKKKPMPKFTLQEARFIRDLIFKKPKNLVFFYLADYIANMQENILFNGVNMKRLKWLYSYMLTLNAAQAARMSGYSRKCAKQQGYRMLKTIQKFSRKQ